MFRTLREVARVSAAVGAITFISAGVAVADNWTITVQNNSQVTADISIFCEKKLVGKANAVKPGPATITIPATGPAYKDKYSWTADYQGKLCGTKPVQITGSQTVPITCSPTTPVLNSKSGGSGLVEMYFDNKTKASIRVKIKDRIGNRSIDGLDLDPGRTDHWTVKLDPNTTDPRAVRVHVEALCFDSNGNQTGRDEFEYFTSGTIHIATVCKLPTSAL
jgi:hypothetical protein